MHAVRISLAFAFVAALALVPARAEALRVPGKAALAAKAASLEAARSPADAPLPLIRLRPLAPGAKILRGEAAGYTEKALRIGIARDVAGETGAEAAPRLDWRPAAGGSGWTARVALESPGAAALRLGVRLRGWPEGAELRVYAAGDASRVVRTDAGQLRRSLREQGLAWTPVTEGDAQVVELWVPGTRDPKAIGLELVSASHLAVGPSSGFKASGIGAAGACQRDVACAAPQDPALARAARSVVKLIYTRNGASYACTGTLVNDGTAGQAPYIYTAAHCIDSPAVAATLDTFWFFEAAQCGGGAPGAYRQVSGGASLLFADEEGDASLVKLNAAAPAGAWFSGWDASPLEAGTAVVALHHPRGDLKKVSRGELPAQEDGGYTTAAWLSGTTEPGSSGSGLFTAGGGEYLLRGGLRGGSASCASSGSVADGDNRDIYSRLDLAAPRLAAWVKATGPAPAADYSGMWYDPAEPGWGITVTQKGDRAILAWYTYDADGIAEWFVVPEISWRGPASIEGKLVRASGSPALGTYEAARFAFTPAGTMAIDFDGDAATVSIAVDGRSLVKPLRKLDP